MMFSERKVEKVFTRGMVACQQGRTILARQYLIELKNLHRKFICWTDDDHVYCNDCIAELERTILCSDRPRYIRTPPYRGERIRAIDHTPFDVSDKTTIICIACIVVCSLIGAIFGSE